MATPHRGGSSALAIPSAERRGTDLSAGCSRRGLAWFAGDTTALAALVPPELVTIESSANTFGTHQSTLADSRAFAASGAKLTRLVFPRTEFHAYGNTAILYTTYEMDIRGDAGPARTVRGAATEVFVQRNGRRLNTGWQLAPRAQ